MDIGFGSLDHYTFGGMLLTVVVEYGEREIAEAPGLGAPRSKVIFLSPKFKRIFSTFHSRNNRLVNSTLINGSRRDLFAE